jgi:hypothetical protein
MKRPLSVLSFLLIILASVPSLVAQESREVNKSAPLSANGRLSIDTYKGSITILPWDKSEIVIHAIIESDGSDRYERDMVDGTEIRIDLTSSSARIKTDYEHAKRRHRGFLGIFNDDSGNLPFVHYTIKVPRTTHVMIKDYKSKTTIDDLQADVDVETYKGEVAIGRLSGALELQTYKGEAHVGFANLTGRSRVETYKGEIELNLPKGKGFDLDADIGRHARLDSDFERVRDNDRRRGYDVRQSVNGGGPQLRLKSEHGTIRVRER